MVFVWQPFVTMLLAGPGVYQNRYNGQFKSAREQALEARFA